MQRIVFFLFLLFCTSVQAQQPVRQSGAVTPGHVPVWLFNNIIGDGGTATEGFLTSLGVTASGPAICQNSGPVTGPFVRLCLGASTAAPAVISLQSFGGATAQQLQFILNGTTYTFPFTTGSVIGPGASAVNDLACWNNTAGTLLADCGAPLAVPGTTVSNDLVCWNSTTGAAVKDCGSFNVQSGSYAVTAADCMGSVYMTGSMRTLTLPSASGFPANCIVTAVNANTVNAQVLSGFPVAIPQSECGTGCLWPTSALQVRNNAGTWVLVGQQARWKKRGIQMFVAASACNDNNDGLTVGTALCTGQKAINIIQADFDNNGGNPTIVLAPGAYTQSFFMGGTITGGGDQISIVGDGNGACDKTQTVVSPGTGQNAFGARDYGIFTVSCLTVGNGSGFTASGFSTVDVIDVVCGTPTTTLEFCMNASESGHVNPLDDIHINGNMAGVLSISGTGSQSEFGSGTITFDRPVTISGAVVTLSASGEFEFGGTFATGGNTVTGQAFIVQSCGRSTPMSKLNTVPGTIHGIIADYCLGTNTPGGFVNLFDNASFAIWKRGPSVTTTNGITADRWWIIASGAAVTAAQQSSLPAGPGTGMAITGNNANTGVIVRQNIENIRITAAAGQNVIWQAQIFNPTNSPIIPKLSTAYANGNDFTSPTPDIAPFNLQTCPANSFCQESAAFTLNDSVDGNGYQINFDFQAGISAAQTAFFFAVDMRIMPGTPSGLIAAPPPVEYRPVTAEAIACARFLPGFGPAAASGGVAVGMAASATTGIIIVPFPVAARVPVTGVAIRAPGDFEVLDSATNPHVLSGVTFAPSTNTSGEVTVSGAASLTAGNAMPFYSVNGNAFMVFTGAEL